MLVELGNAVEYGDANLVQKIRWVENKIASMDSNYHSNQRLAVAFLRALTIRAFRKSTDYDTTSEMTRTMISQLVDAHRLSLVQLASFVEVTPWHWFGYSTANATIVDAVAGFSVVHIVDLTTTHCMQIPTLIDALANRPEGPPLIIRLTVPILTTSKCPPPRVFVSYDEIGLRLVNFAMTHNIYLDFIPIVSDPSDAFDSLIQHVRFHKMQISEASEALVVNCQMLLHMIPDESASTVAGAIQSSSFISLRTVFLNSLRSLNPLVVTLVDEDVDFVSGDFTRRLRSSFNYLWIPFDAVKMSLPEGSEMKQWYENDVCWKVENVIANEGMQRVERQESKARWVERMTRVGFRRMPFGENAATKAQNLLDVHAFTGWGWKNEQGQDLVLTWKGHNVVFATTWIPDLQYNYDLSSLI